MTKVPYDPSTGRRAKANDATTWACRTDAEAYSQKAGYAGVGLMLGSLGDGSGRALGGVDLDTCRNEAGELAPWAHEVLALLGTYAEVSPSGTGAKAYFIYDEADREWLHTAGIVAPGGGKTYKLGTGEHPPAIETFLASRWFATTSQRVPGRPAQLRWASRDTLWRLLAELAPRLVHEAGGAALSPRGGGSQDYASFVSTYPDDPLWARIKVAAETDRGLRNQLAGRVAGGKDMSGSGFAARFAFALARANTFSFDEARQALGTWSATARWAQEKGEKNGQRELRKLWEKATARQLQAEWTEGLDPGRGGGVAPSIKNLLHALRAAPGLANLFRQNTFTSFPEVTRCPPWIDLEDADAVRQYPRSLQDSDLTRLRGWLDQYGLSASVENVQAALAAVAEDNGFHPVRDYLEALQWDGISRLEDMLGDFFAAPNTELNRAFGRRFMVAAVARVMAPGAKVDTAMILEGAQGIGKSSAVALLAGQDWFTDQLPEMGTKDAGLQIQGRWMIELGELNNVTRAEASVVKQFLSVSVDRFRAPYARAPQDHARQCVFVGTINPNGRGYLKDDTGNRRFWIVECRGKLDLAGLTAARDQLWAEALHLYRLGEVWWLNTEALEAQQGALAQDRRDSDPLIDLVRGRIAGIEYADKDVLLRLLTTTHTRRQDGEGSSTSEHTRPATRADEMRLASIMKDLGWEMVRRMENGERRRVYARTEQAEPMAVMEEIRAVEGEEDPPF